MKSNTPSQPTPQTVGQNIADLMPYIIQGAQFEFFAKRTITQTQFFLLMTIYSHGRCSMTILTQFLGVKMPTATGLVNRLVAAKYLRRYSDPQDRRKVYIELTAVGQNFIHQFKAVIKRRWEQVLQGLDPKDLKNFSGVLLKLQSNMGQQ